MTPKARWTFGAANAPNHLRAASDEVDTILGEHRVSESTRFAARLVCEEIVLNALEHGGASFVTMELDPAKDPRVLVFEDDGASFDPEARATERGPDAPGDVGTRGRGLILMHELSRGIRHHRHNGCNRLTVLLAD